MVKLRQSHAYSGVIPDNLEPWLERIKLNNSRLDDAAGGSLLKAVDVVREIENQAPNHSVPGGVDSGRREESCLQAGLEMAEILSELGMDIEGLQASILYRAVRREKLTLASIKDQFGDSVSSLIENVLSMAVITDLRKDNHTRALGRDKEYQTTKVREMLVSIIDDIRVALLKLAERTNAIRVVKDAPEEKRRAVAKEVFDIYAPLAHRLGIGHLKWELEDLAFRYMEPDEYKQIASLLAEKRSARQNYIDQMINTIDAELAKLDKAGEVSGRAKNIHSIWRKMNRKDIGFSQVYDIRAVRVLVPTVSDCYAVLGIVHSKWRNIPNEFDDYIASPKDNGYRSLHTAVIGPGRKVIEIQIRTFEMHEEAEFGICAHWHYKDSDAHVSKSHEDKMAWLRQVLEWHDNIGDQAIGDFIQEERDSDRVYVFTPNGHVIDLPSGATPVDFAYQIHTEIGHRCKGAKVNDQVVPLDSQLKTADQVEIITGKSVEPNRDWLNSSLDYIKTARAKTKVQQWFKSQDIDMNIQAGKVMLEEEFRRMGLDTDLVGEMAQKFICKDNDEFYGKLGSGQLDIHDVVNSAEIKAWVDPNDPGSVMQQAQQYQRTDHYIYGAGDMPVRIAECCGPRPGQDINGYRTKDRGLAVHRTDCGNFLRLKGLEPLNIIELNWGDSPHSVFSVTVAIKSYDRGGLLSDITSLIDELHLSIQALKTEVMEDGIAVIEFTTEVGALEQLSKLLTRIRQIPNIVDVWRVVDERSG